MRKNIREENKEMKKPYVICHILSALDGKITGAFMCTEPAQIGAGEYARIRNEYHADAWLYGTVTTKEFTGGAVPVLEGGKKVPEGDFVADANAEVYYVSVDINGEIGWESGVLHKAGRPDSHVIEVLTEKTPMAYKAYLRKKGVSYIVAGQDILDCQMVMEKLSQLFKINKVLICGGGTVNWTFLESGMVDELSLLIAPVTDGNPDTVSVFEKHPLLPEHAPVTFHLKNIEKLKEDNIHLVYTVRK